MLTEAATAQSTATAEYEIYSLKYKPVADVELMLEDLLKDVGVSTHLVADRQKNQILLRGPAQAQQIAKQLIESVDRRPVIRAVDKKPVVKSYPIERGSLDEAAASLRTRFQNDESVRVAVDASASQLLVLAPPEIHGWINTRLTQSEPARGQQPARRPEGALKPIPHRREAERPREQFISLINSQADELVPMLRQLFGKRMQPSRTTGSTYVLSDISGQDVEIGIDSRRNQLIVYGPESATAQLVQLVRALDSREETKGHRVRILALRRSNSDKVEEAMKAYRGELRKVPTRKSKQNKTENHGSHLIHDSQIRQANFAFQEAGSDPGSDANDSQGPPEADLEGQRERLRELGTDVEVETLPDLDVIILRGRDRDVEEMTRIINEIERLSGEAEPEIDIVYLKHVDSQQLAILITGVMEDLVGLRQGRVQLTPLLKPNALLLIGWGEAMEVIKELIVALDLPVDPDSQLRVFRLKHAQASQAQQTVQQFFINRPGLSAAVRVTADPRTNSLIVQAAPRDMKDVELLVSRIDVMSSAVVNQARIFALKNSLATDVAQILQQATSGAPGPGGQASSILELLAIDTQGEKILKSGLLSNVKITPDPRKNTLLISAPPESMDLLAELIRQLDEIPVDAAQIKVFRIINSDAGDLVQMLRSLLPTETGANLGPQIAGAEGETSLAPLRFAIDTRTNSIIASGSTGDLRDYRGPVTEAG